MVFADQSTGLVNVNWGPVVTGLYARHLQRWLHYFPLSSIHVVDGENLVRNPAAEMNLVEVVMSRLEKLFGTVFVVLYYRQQNKWYPQRIVRKTTVTAALCNEIWQQ